MADTRGRGLLPFHHQGSPGYDYDSTVFLDVGFYVWLSFLIPCAILCYILHALSPPLLYLLALNFSGMDRSEQGNASPGDHELELNLPHLLFTKTARELYAKIVNEWDFLKKSACQTAAGRALWKHVVHDPLADVLAGETYLRNLHEKIKKDRRNNAREISGVILAVRTLWFDSKIEAVLDSSGGAAQVVLLGAGMDSRAYRLSCLKESDVFEVDFSEVLQVKAALLEEALKSTEHLRLMAKSLTRVAADIRENDWLEKLQISGFVPEKNTVWVLEGIIYYLSNSQAMQVLKIVGEKCALTHTVLLADFMNKASTTLSSSTFHFYSDWPDHLLPSLGFSHVKLSQIGDPDAHFGLMHDPMNLFNKLRNLPRSVETHPDDGTPCCRLYLVQASGSPNQTVSLKPPP